MTFAAPILALVIGVCLAYFLKVEPAGGLTGSYLAMACLAGFDTVLGGIKGGLEDRFETAVFVSGFFVNVLLAFFLAYLGDQIGVNLYLVVAFVFGNRIFTNLSIIRRMVVTKVHDGLRRRERQAAVAPTTENPS